jgi:2,3-diaminopropionate biosynthesis protein SbnA
MLTRMKMIVNFVSDIMSQPIFYYLSDLISNSHVYLKLEGLNSAQSIKLKAAKYLIDGLEARGELKKGVSKIIESSSGNLGIALSMICKEKGYDFTCVIDPNILVEKEKKLKLYLGTRINFIQNLIDNDDKYVWVNQYANKDNIKAHFCSTAREILEEVPQVDYLFIGAGTTGTLMGCAQYFRKYSPDTKIIAVDAVGSVTFDDTPQRRLIPGIGTSRKPEIIDFSYIDKVVLVNEIDTIRSCRDLLHKYGLFLGGSSGSVMHAIKALNNEKPYNKSTIVAISPDFGDQYQDTIYNNEWVSTNYV